MNILLTKEQVNEHGQITDKSILGKERYKFGFVNILFQGEEAGLIPVYTVIARALGGDALHIGICGAFSVVHSMVQWVGALLLRKHNSNQKAMKAALWAGAICAIAVCAFILVAFVPALKVCSLWGYLILGLMLAGISGVLWNVETSWIGDLVPKSILGWFSSVKWIVAVFGLLCFTLIFGKLVDIYPHIITYASLFLIVGVSHIIGVFLVSTITDRTPKNANFISSKDRLNYKSIALWCYIAFYIFWGSGRTALLAFQTAYLLDYFNFSMTKVASMFAIQNAIVMILLFFMGKISDKYGNRMLLLLVSAFVSIGMFLWFASAWWGTLPIIVYYFINGAAGHTHSMLGINYGLEIFPDKGRAGYFGFIRIVVGIANVSAVIFSGVIMRSIEGYKCVLWGAELNHYHIFFAVCALVTFCSTITLVVAGKRVVTAA